MLNILVNTPAVNDYDFSSLRAVLSGGDPIASEVVRRIMETFKCDYIQTYGMTETSPYLTLSIMKESLIHLSPEEQFHYKAKTGRPFIGVLLKVVREKRFGNTEFKEGYVKALEGLLLSYRSGDERDFLNRAPFDRKSMQRYKKEFRAFVRDGVHSPFDVGYFMAWSDLVQYRLDTKKKR